MQIISKILQNEEGQLLPFIAVIMILLILFTALQFGLSMAYLSRIKVRDALDSAVLSAVSLAERRTSPTYYGERKKVIRDEEGNIVRVEWVKTTKNNETINVDKTGKEVLRIKEHTGLNFHEGLARIIRYYLF